MMRKDVLERTPALPPTAQPEQTRSLSSDLPTTSRTSCERVVTNHAPVNLMGQPPNGALTSAPGVALLFQPKSLPKTLAGDEARERNECEKVISRGWDTFLEVGSALATIRDKRLYRDAYETFEEYCRTRWEFSKTHANRLIEAAAVAAVLTPIGVKIKSESQLRPLVCLAPQKIPAAWRKAEELAGDGKVTAKLVRLAVAEFKTPLMRDFKSTPTPKPASTRKLLTIALELIREAEKAANNKDIRAVLKALKRLRRCLQDQNAC